MLVGFLSPPPKKNHSSTPSPKCCSSPFESKGRLRCVFCRGGSCKRCGVDAYKHQPEPAIEQLHSTWICSTILAMQRPNSAMMPHLIEQFRSHAITAVFNLTEPGEHPFCGHGILTSSGFPYHPEAFMASGIKHFNYSWPDMTTPSISLMKDVVRSARNEILKGGKIAVHCHAGYGRTGITIAAVLIAVEGNDADTVIQLIRSKRKGSVQTKRQEEFVKEFEQCHWNALMVFPMATSPHDSSPSDLIAAPDAPLLAASTPVVSDKSIADGVVDQLYSLSAGEYEDPNRRLELRWVHKCVLLSVRSLCQSIHAMSQAGHRIESYAQVIRIMCTAASGLGVTPTAASTTGGSMSSLHASLKVDGVTWKIFSETEKTSVVGGGGASLGDDGKSTVLVGDIKAQINRGNWQLFDQQCVALQHTSSLMANKNKQVSFMNLKQSDHSSTTPRSLKLPAAAATTATTTTTTSLTPASEIQLKKKDSNDSNLWPKKLSPQSSLGEKKTKVMESSSSSSPPTAALSTMQLPQIDTPRTDQVQRDSCVKALTQILIDFLDSRSDAVFADGLVDQFVLVWQEHRTPIHDEAVSIQLLARIHQLIADSKMDRTKLSLLQQVINLLRTIHTTMATESINSTPSTLITTAAFSPNTSTPRANLLQKESSRRISLLSTGAVSQKLHYTLICSRLSVSSTLSLRSDSHLVFPSTVSGHGQRLRFHPMIAVSILNELICGYNVDEDESSLLKLLAVSRTLTLLVRMGWSHVSLLPNRLCLNSKIAQNVAGSTPPVPVVTADNENGNTDGSIVSTDEELTTVLPSEENQRKVIAALAGTGTGTPTATADDGDGVQSLKPDPSLASLVTVETTTP